MFSDAIAHIKLRAEIELQQIDELVKKQIQEQGVQMQEVMKRSDALYDERKKKLNYQQEMLDPKRQIKRVFPILFFALVFLVLYLIAEKYIWFEVYNIYALVVLLFLSVGCAVTGVIFLKCITWTVIDIKAQLAQDKEKSEVEERVVSTTTTTTTIEK